MIRSVLMPVGVLAILSSMLLPLPPFLVDFLLVGNLVVALLLVGSALYLSEPTKLSVLPTILLLATLYRLALNVSTTRLILGQGSAGEMIETFGALLMQGSLVVGVVVFFVITLVQFIVIAKGAERVAEVSARFTLDALPGKQMSIDSDMRSGLIDLETARQKRAELQIESRFYGALDGAMKFVKGDAIAGIVITFVNIIGGLTIGVAVAGLEISSALSQYTLLTVGDGLLSQIPALLNSLAAGLIITRVTRDDGRSLADEMVSQIGALKPALLLAGGMSLLLAFVPGTPWYFFVALAVFLFAAYHSAEKPAQSSHSGELTVFAPKAPAPLEVIIPHDLRESLSTKDAFLSEMNRFLSEVHGTTGLCLLPPEFRLDGSSDQIEILLRGCLAKKISFPDELGVNERLPHLMSQLKDFVVAHCEEFIDDISTRRLLDHFEKVAPELVASVVPTVISVTQLTTLLKNLAEEQVSFVGVDQILQAVSEAGSLASDPRLLLELTRKALRRSISAKLQQANLSLLRLHPALDYRFAESEQGGIPLPLEAIQAVERGIQEAEEINGSTLCLLCSGKARRLLWDLLQASRVPAIVLADGEVGEEVKVQEGELFPRSFEEEVEVLAA